MQRSQSPFFTNQVMDGRHGIAEHIEELNMQTDTRGYCVGLSEMFMLAGLACEIWRFNERKFELDNTHPVILSDELTMARQRWQSAININTKIKPQSELRAALEAEWNNEVYLQSLISTEIFLSCVSLLQCRQSLHHFVGGYHLTIRQMEKNILPLVLPDRVRAEGGIERVFSKLLALTLDQFHLFLHLLVREIKHSTLNLAIRIYSSGHQSALVYHGYIQEWNYYDSDYVCSKVFTDVRLLAQEIFNHHAANHHMIIGFDMITTEVHAESLRSIINRLDDTSFAQLCAITSATAQVLDKNNTSLLFLACMTGEHEVAKQLLRLGVNPDLQHVASGSTALRIAVEYKQDECIDLLVAARVNVNLAAMNGETPLHASLRSRDFRNFKVLLEAGADPFQINTKGDSVLSLAKLIQDKRFYGLISAKYSLAPLSVKVRNILPVERALIPVKREREQVGLFNETSERPTRLAKVKALTRLLDAGEGGRYPHLIIKNKY